MWTAWWRTIRWQRSAARQDEYTPGGAAGKRPDRSATVYTQLAKQAYPDLPVILGGLEASLRRFAHYDYWLDDVLPSIVESSGADIVSFGMGERQTAEIARRLAAGEPVEEITGVAGTCYLTDFAGLPASYVECASFAKVRADKTAYARACRIQMDNQDVVSGKPVVQKQSKQVSGAEHRRRRRSPGGSWTPCMRFPLRGAIIPPTKRWAACLPSKRWNFPSSTTAAASAAAISAPSSLHQGRRVTSPQRGQRGARRPRP